MAAFFESVQRHIDKAAFQFAARLLDQLQAVQRLLCAGEQFEDQEFFAVHGSQFMSIDIFVQRGAGSKPGENIVDPLVSSIPVAIQRGRNELDERSHAQQDVELETVYRAGVRLGNLSRDHDMHSGEIWTGKNIGITHNVRRVGDSVQTTTTLRVKRPV